MIEITSHRQGAILNRHHGEETADRLRVTIQGISETGRPVKVNGIPATKNSSNIVIQNKQPKLRLKGK